MSNPQSQKTSESIKSTGPFANLPRQNPPDQPVSDTRPRTESEPLSQDLTAEVSQSKDLHLVFVSALPGCAGEDSWVSRLIQDLEQAGCRPSVLSWGTQFSRENAAELLRAIAACEHIFMVCSPGALHDRPGEGGLFAIEKNGQSRSTTAQSGAPKAIHVLLLREADDKSVREFFQQYHAIDFRKNSRTFEQAARFLCGMHGSSNEQAAFEEAFCLIAGRRTSPGTAAEPAGADSNFDPVLFQNSLQRMGHEAVEATVEVGRSSALRRTDQLAGPSPNTPDHSRSDLQRGSRVWIPEFLGNKAVPEPSIRSEVSPGWEFLEILSHMLQVVVELISCLH